MRGPTCASSTSIVPETAFFRLLQDDDKIDNASRSSVADHAKFIPGTNNFLASRIGAGKMQSVPRSVKHFTMAGYSETPLAQKLGIKPGTIVVAINVPENYRKLLEPIPSGVNFATRPVDNTRFVHLFATRRSELATQLSILRRKIAEDAALWVSWPKKSSGVATDITEDII